MISERERGIETETERKEKRGKGKGKGKEKKQLWLMFKCSSKVLFGYNWDFFRSAWI